MQFPLTINIYKTIDCIVYFQEGPLSPEATQCPPRFLSHVTRVNKILRKKKKKNITYSQKIFDPQEVG